MRGMLFEPLSRFIGCIVEGVKLAKVIVPDAKTVAQSVRLCHSLVLMLVNTLFKLMV